MLMRLNSKITFIWVGAGWAHKNQNSKGRLADNYGFPADISITQKGLVDEFEKRFYKSDILYTEKVIKCKLSSSFGKKMSFVSPNKQDNRHNSPDS